MPTIELTQEDYDLLMELSEELQTQENDSQAFPYFWGPRSTKTGIGTEDDTPMVYDSNASEAYTLEDWTENNEDEFKEYLEYDNYPEDSTYEDIGMDSSLCLWIEQHCPDCHIVYSREEQVSEHNFSLFKSDVKNFIKYNDYHLGVNPHTYARTIWRMPKMEKLVTLMYKMKELPQSEINKEAAHYTCK